MLNMSPVAEIVEHELEGLLGLLDLLAAHAAGAVDDEMTVFAGRSLVRRLDFRAGQQQKEAVVVPFGPVADDARAELAVVGVVKRAGNRLVGIWSGHLVLHNRVLAVRPLHVDGVRRAVDALHLRRVVSIEASMEIFSTGVRTVLGRGKRNDKIRELAVSFAAAG